MVPLDPPHQELLDALDEGAGLLRRYRAPGWAGFLDNVRAGVADDDRDALDALVAAVYGGMGSLGDLVLTTGDPEEPFNDELRAANDRFDALRIAMGRHARTLKDELGRG